MSYRNLVKLACLAVLVTAFCLVSTFPAAAGDGPVQFRTRYPVEYTWWHACVGQTIHWQGDIQWVSHATTDGNGWTHTAYHGYSALQGVTDGGLRYVGHWNSDQVWHDRGTGPWEHTFIEHSQFASQGTGVTLVMHRTWHITVNSNGETSARQEQVSFECKQEQEP